MKEEQKKVLFVELRPAVFQALNQVVGKFAEHSVNNNQIERCLNNATLTLCNAISGWNDSAPSDETEKSFRIPEIDFPLTIKPRTKFRIPDPEAKDEWPDVRTSGHVSALTSIQASLKYQSRENWPGYFESRLTMAVRAMQSIGIAPDLKLDVVIEPYEDGHMFLITDASHDITNGPKAVVRFKYKDDFLSEAELLCMVKNPHGAVLYGTHKYEADLAEVMASLTLPSHAMYAIPHHILKWIVKGEIPAKTSVPVTKGMFVPECGMPAFDNAPIKRFDTTTPPRWAKTLERKEQLSTDPEWHRPFPVEALRRTSGNGEGPVWMASMVKHLNAELDSLSGEMKILLCFDYYPGGGCLSERTLIRWMTGPNEVMHRVVLIVPEYQEDILTKVQVSLYNNVDDENTQEEYSGTYSPQPASSEKPQIHLSQLSHHLANWMWKGDMPVA